MISHRICVLGGTGFVGRHLTTCLAAAGHRCRILARHPERHRDLQLVPGLELRPAGSLHSADLAENMQGCTCILNLAGILNEGRGRSFRSTHVDLVERILDAAESAAIGRYLHMSALNADATNGTSLYLRTKGAGEDLAHGRTDLEVTSFRPSVIFGRGDSFLNRFAALLKITPRVFPLACAHARFAPVYVGDVAAAMTNALADPGSVGKRYDLCGPRTYALKELVEHTAGLIGRKVTVVGLPDAAARLQARVFQLLPGKPFTMDNYLSLQVDSVCAHNGLHELGIQPRSLESLGPSCLQ